MEVYDSAPRAALVLWTSTKGIPRIGRGHTRRAQVQDEETMGPSLVLRGIGMENVLHRNSCCPDSLMSHTRL